MPCSSSLLDTTPPVRARLAHWLAWLRAWPERRFVATVGRELLALHQATAARQPALSGRALYREIVRTRTAGTVDSAERLLRGAEQSYAEWPSSRPLGFRDVVHFLAVQEYCASRPARGWTRERLQPVVDRLIPPDL